MKEKNQMIISLDKDKASEKIHLQVMIKTQQISYRRNLLQHNNDHI